MKERLEISKKELRELGDKDYELVRNLSQPYIFKLIRLANELGLEGKKIKEIVGIQENFSAGNYYIDFICE